tara:strand:- start:1561 stop:1776 length:216 start_codon:yes stop_codon:yes gene_type:complete
MSEFTYYKYNGGDERRSPIYFKVDKKSGYYWQRRSYGGWKDGRILFKELRQAVRVHCKEISEDEILIEFIK